MRTSVVLGMLVANISDTWMLLCFPPMQEESTKDFRWHPAPGQPALGASSVSLTGVDHLLLLHLERGQVHRQGESLVHIKTLHLITAGVLDVLTFCTVREVLVIPWEPPSD